jgi:alpha-tubulin suppressor-like RCC1 family protein
MRKDPINYNFTENGINYDFSDVFVPTKEVIGLDSPIFGWGRNNVGQLGITDKIYRSTPVNVAVIARSWDFVSACTQTATIKTDGTLWIWGWNTDGALGTNSSIGATSTPVTTFAGGTDWKTISCGIYANAAIKRDGTLWVWGTGASIGINTTRSVSTPVTTFAGGNNWKSVSCDTATLAIKNDGTLWAWGENSTGTLGTNDTINRLTPVTTFAGGTNWKTASVSTVSTAIKTDGTLWIWGRNIYGELGINSLVAKSTPVTTFAGGTNWSTVDAAIANVVAIKTDGTLWTWGYNGNGLVGINNSIDKSTPVTTFAGGTNWKQCDVYENTIAAIKTDGTLWEWGPYTGTNDGRVRSTPVTTFLGGTKWKQVSNGQNGFKVGIILTNLYEGTVV